MMNPLHPIPPLRVENDGTLLENLTLRSGALLTSRPGGWGEPQQCPHNRAGSGLSLRVRQETREAMID